MNYYKRHLGDYAKDTGHLSLSEHGAYTLLLDWAYANEQPIAANKAYRICKATTPAEREAVDFVLKEFFVLDNETWTNARVLKEISSAEQRREMYSEFGRKGGRPKTQQVSRENLTGSQDQTQQVSDSKATRTRVHNTTTPILHEQEHIGASPDGDALPPTKSDLIPYERIVELFNTTMTRLAKVREVTTKRRTLIRSAWQGSTQRRSLEFWQDYFEECEADAFLNGTGPYRNGHENWRPDFDYLLKSDVVTRVFEKALDRMERRA